VAARAGGHPFPTVLGDELVHAGASLDAGERRGGRKYHKGRTALSTTSPRVASARTGWGKDAAWAEAWEEVAVKVQASQTSGRFIRARETAVSEPSDTGLRVIWREERWSPVGGSSERSTASLYVVVGTRRGLDGHLPMVGGNKRVTYPGWVGGSIQVYN
jgi:hypothetical protein